MHLPIVALVGRPNVGKSTLFNRMVGKRLAIVADLPGITRDRHYEIIRWKDKSFLLVDTGGFETRPANELLKRVKEQALFAIEEADLVIHLGDSKEGPTPVDYELVDLLRKSGKEIILGINKIDQEKDQEKIGEFYALGVENIFPLSAEHNRGVEDLLDYLTSFLSCGGEDNFSAEDNPGEIPKLCLLGKPNVGKSLLLNRLIGREKQLVSSIPGTTRDSIDTLYKKGEREYLFIDTAGIKRKSRLKFKIEKYCVIMALKSLARSDIALLVIDAEQGVTDQDKKIAGYTREMGKGCIIVVNKWDLIKKDTQTAKDYLKWVAQGLKEISYAPLISISAKTGQRVVKIFPLVERIVGEYSRKVGTALLNKTIREIIKLRPLPHYRGRLIKFYYATQVNTRPPAFIFYLNYPEGVTSSYLKFLKNRFLEFLKFEGVPLVFVLKKRE